MAWTTSKTTIAVSAGVLLVVGITGITIREIQKHRAYAWETPEADFSLLSQTPAQVVIVPTKFDGDRSWFYESSRGAMGVAEPLQAIIQAAYQKNKFQTVFATRLPSTKFNFFAKVSNTPSRYDFARWTAALQQLIAKKFGIRGRLEKRETAVLVLKPCNTGVQGFKVSHTMPDGHAIINNHDGNFSFYEQPIETLTSLLERRFQIPIVDQTGLTERYDFSLSWDEPDRSHPNLDGLKEALRNQLGLELVPANQPIEMLVVGKAK